MLPAAPWTATCCSSHASNHAACPQVTKQEQGRRQPFEAAIKRPYFHIKPLDAAQLGNWQRYLDHSEQAGDMGSTVRLYERCLVACASYAGAACSPACAAADLLPVLCSAAALSPAHPEGQAAQGTCVRLQRPDQIRP